MKNNLRKIRNERALTGEILAKLLNISVQHYYGLERGTKTLNQYYLEKLSDYYGVTIDYLLGRSEPNESTEELPKDMQVILRNASKLTSEQLKVIKDITKQFRETNEKLAKNED